MLMENNHVILNGLILDRRPDHEVYGENVNSINTEEEDKCDGKVI